MSDRVQPVRFRHCLSILVAAMAFFFFADNAYSWQGSGTAADPYRLGSKADIDSLRQLPDGGAWRHFSLTADINADTLACPIDYFNGTLHGNGHTLTYVMHQQRDSAALFLTLGPGASVSHLQLRGSVSGINNVASLACVAMGTLYGIVSDMEITASGSRAAGIATTAAGGSILDSCILHGQVRASMYAAGIAADCSGYISNCHCQGAVAAQAYAAGIAAQMLPSGFITDCSNHSDMTLPASDYVAGIAACTSVTGSATLRRCSNSGRISARDYAGGIGARIEAGLVVDSCINDGSITASGRYAAGIVALLNGASGRRAYATDCINRGDISGQGEYIGGITGFSYQYVSITGCINYGLITHDGTSGAYIGGISGMSFSRLEQCANAGNVTAMHGYAVGGIAGAAENISYITQCYNTGTITAGSAPARGNRGIAGGLTGDVSQTTITDSFNLGTVTADEAVGGLCGLIHSQTKFQSCYNAGNVTAHNVGSLPIGAIGAYALDANVNTISAQTLYYDAQQCIRVSEFDLTHATGLTTDQLCLTAPSSYFSVAPWCYPIPAEALPQAILASACIGFAIPGDNAEYINGDIHIGLRPGLEWTLSRCFEFVTPTLIKPIHRGESDIIVTDISTRASRSFHLTVKSYSEATSPEASPLHRGIWFTLDGIRTQHPCTGKVYIRLTRLPDGTLLTEKVTYTPE